MYASYFGLKEAPFSIAPDPHYLYMSDRHREAFAHLLYGLEEGGGFVQLTGEVGTGKTTLCRCLLAQLPEYVDVAFILNPRLTEVELLATLCDELRIECPPERLSVKLLVDALYRYLLDAQARGRRTVLIIDEAQNLSTGVLEQIRLLTNLETTTQKLLRVILIGQPELIKLLDREELRQLAQRITARYHLLPFSKRETRHYIAHRMEVAGGTLQVFTAPALRRIYRFSRGVPRLINVICDRALLGAYVQNRPKVDANTARKAIGEVSGHRVGARFARAFRWVAASGLAAGLMAGAWTWLPTADFGSRLALNKSRGTQGLIPTAVPDNTEREAATTPDKASDGNEPENPTATAAVGKAPDPPVTASTDTAAPAKLAEILTDPTVRSDREAAFAGLFSLWRVDAYIAGAGLPCDQARERGLRCLARSGTWNNLRLLHLPAMLELDDPPAGTHYATLTVLGERTATLVVGQRSVTLPLSEIDPLWYGRYLVLWKTPDPGLVMLAPGTRSRKVVWLTRRLSAIEGAPLLAENQDLYDDALKQRVIAFQRGHALNPDGIVGQETLVHLSTAVRNPEVPLLGQADP